MRRSSVDNADYAHVGTQSATRNRDMMSKTMQNFGNFSVKKDFRVGEKGSGSPALGRNINSMMAQYTPHRKQPVDDAAS